MPPAPPVGSTTMPSTVRSRPRRAARVSTAIWSLTPSTSTMARAATALGSAAKVASVAAAGPLTYPARSSSLSSARMTPLLTTAPGMRQPI